MDFTSQPNTAVTCAFSGTLILSGIRTTKIPSTRNLPFQVPV